MAQREEGTQRLATGAGEPGGNPSQTSRWSPQPDKAEQAAQSLLDQYAQLKAQYADKPYIQC